MNLTSARPSVAESGEGDQLTKEELNALLRNDLFSFSVRCFEELNPAVSFLPNWHQVLIASKLEACLRGECRRLIINLPPRHLKSLFASIALPAFWLGRKPSTRIVCVSFAQDLANDFARDCRQVMGAEWYREVFPKFRLSAKRDAVEDFRTKPGGRRLALGVGGALTGRGGDVIILDDPLKPSEAASDTQRANVNTWFDKTLYSRLDHQKTGVIIIVMQRLHIEDLVAHVSAKEKWEVLSLPALAEQEERHEFLVHGEPARYVRKRGEILHEARQDPETLAQIRKSMNEYEFSAQFQQRPVPLDGGLVKTAWWQFYEQVPGKFDKVIQSWDTASKSTEFSDYSVCTTWGWMGRKLYLLDVFREKLEYPDLKRAVKQQASRFKPNLILMEDKASGMALLQELPHEGVRGLLACTPVGDKKTRLYTGLDWIERGDVLLPRQAPWLADYRRELEAFPYGGGIDDQVDSTSQVLAWAKKNSWSGHGLVVGGPPRISEEFLDSYVHGGRCIRL